MAGSGVTATIVIDGIKATQSRLTYPSIVQQPYSILEVLITDYPLAPFSRTLHVARKIHKEIQRVLGGEIGGKRPLERMTKRRRFRPRSRDRGSTG